MLKKKEYWYTLGAAALTFFLVFAICYMVTSRQNTLNDQAGETIDIGEVLENDKAIKQDLSIKPYTKVTLSIQNRGKVTLKEVAISPDALLGMTKSELENRFKNYTVQAFNEDEVKLIRIVEEEGSAPVSQSYVLGIQDHYVCIKSKDQHALIAQLEVCADHFSSYTYSLLLKESITISQDQKDALLKDAGVLEQILQNDEEE